MEKKGVREEGMKSYCVTGSTGYIASWLVNSLLRNNCYVHATVRNPGLSAILRFDVVLFSE